MSTLVAGFGNIFLSDDGLGSAVIRMLAGTELGPDVRIRDFGTGGTYLALEMLNGYDTVVIVDAVARPDPPGTVFMIDCSSECTILQSAPDAHAMSLGAVFGLYAAMQDQSGARHDTKIFVVGCVPQNVDAGMELSEPVRAALPACVDMVIHLTKQSVASGAKS